MTKDLAEVDAVFAAVLSETEGESGENGWPASVFSAPPEPAGDLGKLER